MEDRHVICCPLLGPAPNTHLIGMLLCKSPFPCAPELCLLPACPTSQQLSAVSQRGDSCHASAASA